MDAARGRLYDGLFCACASVHVNGGNRAARNQFVAMAALYGLLHAVAGLRRLVHNFSGRAAAGLLLKSLCSTGKQSRSRS